MLFKTLDRRLLLLTIVAVLAGCGSLRSLQDSPVLYDLVVYDIVLKDGRVIDPESGLDAVRNVGINGNTITAITKADIQGKKELDAKGLVVAPGFIDLHNHSPTPLGQQYQALDGVTTTLELEAGAFPIKEFGKYLRGGALLNFGASTGHAITRERLKHGIDYVHMVDSADLGITFDSRGFKEKATAEEVAALRLMLEQGIDQGGLGIGLLLDYMSDAVSADELRMIFEVAGERQAPVFVHVRRGIAGDISGLNEVIQLAKQTNAPVHICHIQHNAMKNIDGFLQAIEQANNEGADITTEVLPYNAGSTTISAAVFHRDWQSIFDITYEDVEWAATGERFNKETWEHYQETYPGGSVIHHYLDEDWTRTAVAADGVIVVTDGLPIVSTETNVPPQGIGSFSKVLGTYARNEQLLSLNKAIAKMTLLPARRMQTIAPVFERKGRVQIGADADLAIFDPLTIKGNSTYQKPHQASTGVVYLLVNGELVVDGGQIVEGVFPGQRMLGTITSN